MKTENLLYFIWTEIFISWIYFLLKQSSLVFFLPPACSAKVQQCSLIKVYSKHGIAWKMLAQWTCYFQLQRIQACLGLLKYCTPFPMPWRGIVVLPEKNLSFIYSQHFRQHFRAWQRLLLVIAVHKVHSRSPFFSKECCFPPPLSSRLFYFLGNSGAIYMPFGSCKKFSIQLSNWIEVKCSPVQTDGLV